MKFTAKDLYNAAMIGIRMRIEYVENNQNREMEAEIVGINPTHLTVRTAMFRNNTEIPLNSIQSLERLNDAPEDMARRIEEFLRMKHRYIHDKENKIFCEKKYRLDLIRRFEGDIAELTQYVSGLEGCDELAAFLTNNGALAGNVSGQPMDLIEAQLEKACAGLEAPKAAFARCLIALTRRDMIGVMKVYLDIMGERPDEAFIRACAARIAVASVHLNGHLENQCAFIFWLDRLLEVDPAQLYNDPALWYNYLRRCVGFQHFDPLCRMLRVIKEEDVVFDALAYVLAQNEQPVYACRALDRLEHAYGANYTPGQLMLTLEDDDRSYCARYIKQVYCMMEEHLLGAADRGYIYDYVRLKGFAHIMNGYLVNYFVNLKDVEQYLKDDMDECLTQGLDFEPELVRFTPHPGGVATNVKR